MELEALWNKKSKREIEQELARYYRESLQILDEKIAALYAKFATDNGMDMVAAHRLIMGAEYRDWRMSLKEYLSEYSRTGDKALLRELNTLSMRSRITRLDKLYADTLREMVRLSGRTEAAFNRYLPSPFKDFYYHGLFDIGQKRGLDNAVTQVSNARIERVLRTPWSGKNYSERIWRNNAKLGASIQREIVAGMHRGATLQDLSRSLAQRMSVGMSDATRLVRTEMCYVQNQGALAGLIDAGMPFFLFIATIDRRTSLQCREMDGRVFPVEEATPGVNIPPLHPRCRSVISGSLTGENGQKGSRIARTEQDHTIKIPANMSYKDFQAVYVDKKMSAEAWQARAGNGIISIGDTNPVRQAKSRDHKIFITDIAIDKVGYVDVPGFSKAQSAELQRQHQELLKVAQTSNNSDEVLVLRKWLTGENLKPIFGSTNEVDINNSIEAQTFFRDSYEREIVLMHNHPSTKGFSYADIGYFISNDYLELMTVVSNQGEVHCLRKMPNFDFALSQKIYKENYLRFDPDQQIEMVRDFIKSCKKGGIAYARS